MESGNQNLKLELKRKTGSSIGSLGLLAALVILLGFTASVAYAHHVNVSSGLTAGGAPLAIHGYDPVAYFTKGQAHVGKATFTAVHEGVAYRFASQSNKTTFEKNPQRYAPQYGGYCAFGVSVGAKFDGDPTLWRIVNDKLYFNLNPEIQEKWLEDVPGNIAKADRNWRQIRDKAPSDLN